MLRFGFKTTEAGKTAGSGVKFINAHGKKIYLHKPHPTGILKRYQLKQIKEILEL
ncbi:MAG: type II toxin-antitoxin system HicA family toxin [Saprospiraceae bacterium]